MVSFIFFVIILSAISHSLDSDNLGTAVIEALYSTVSYAVDSLVTLEKEYMDFRITRAKLCVRICTAPYNEDLRAAFHATDLDLFYNLRQNVATIIDIFVSAYDALGKNMEKVKHPRQMPTKHWMY